MKKVIILAVAATLCAAAAQANPVRPGGKKSAQKIDAAVTNMLLAAVENAQKEASAAAYADNSASARSNTQAGQPVSEAEMCRRMGAFLDACDKGRRPAKAKLAPKPRVRTQAPAKTPEQQAAEKKEAERKRKQREAFWQMYYEALSNISRAGK